MTAVAAADAFGATAESTLGFADAPISELRDRVLRGMRFTFSWASALSDAQSSPAFLVSGSDGAAAALALQVRVAAMQDALSALLNMLRPSDLFAGKDVVAGYEQTSQTFAQLYRDLALSLATLPQRALLDQLGDLGSAVFKAPAAVAKTLAEEIAQLIRNLLGNTAAALWSNLWPYLLIAAGVGLAYVFRAPLLRALGKVSA